MFHRTLKLNKLLHYLVKYKYASVVMFSMSVFTKTYIKIKFLSQRNSYYLARITEPKHASDSIQQ